MANYPYYPSPQGINQFYQSRFMAPEQPQPQIGIKGRPVSSIDEVRATTIDFDGSVFYFPDLANKRIYTKQINYDGTSTLNTYELKPTPINSQNQYVTREEFQNLLIELQKRFTAAAEMQGAPQIPQQLADSKQEVAASQSKEQPQPQASQFNF